MTKLAYPIRSQLVYDGDSTFVNYVGEAAFGVSESAAFWRIKRITYTGSSLKIDWADGNDAFDNIWADRTTLAYS